VRYKAWWRGGGLAIAAVSLVAASGCGGETTDVSKGVANINKDLLSAQGVRLDCPKTVDGGAGTVFTCTIRNTKNKRSAKLRMKVAKQNGQLAVDIASEKEFRAALQKIGAA
jgi:hypothetical protein